MEEQYERRLLFSTILEGLTDIVMRTYTVAIAGATGAVGTEFLKLLESREFPLSSLRLLASERSAGRSLSFRDRPHTVELLTGDSFAGVDIAFFSAGGSRSK